MSKATKEPEQQELGITLNGKTPTGLGYVPWHEPLCRPKDRPCPGCDERRDRVKTNTKAAAAVGILLGGEFPTEPIKHCRICVIPCYPGKTGTGDLIGVWGWNASVDHSKWFLETHMSDDLVAPSICPRCRAVNAE